MLLHSLFFAEVLLTATLFALVEIHIEGPDGWASKLPTWRIQNRVTRWLLGCKPLTGYHLYLLLFMFSVLHLPYALDLARPALAYELRILAFMILFWICEDFLWFLLNPAFGWKNFRPEKIWWHAPAWWWIMPRDYWLFFPFGLALYFLSWNI